jgi:hypothetical protein
VVVVVVVDWEDAACCAMSAPLIAPRAKPRKRVFQFMGTLL